MKTRANCVLAALAIAATGLVAAQDSTVQIRASDTKPIKLMQGDFNDFASLYQLSNGRYIKFSTQERRYYARLDNGQRTEIFPVARTVFMTASGAQFTFRDSGDSLTVNNYETLPMAGVTGHNVTLVASR